VGVSIVAWKIILVTHLATRAVWGVHRLTSGAHCNHWLQFYPRLMDFYNHYLNYGIIPLLRGFC